MPARQHSFDELQETQELQYIVNQLTVNVEPPDSETSEISTHGSSSLSDDAKDDDSEDSSDESEEELGILLRSGGVPAPEGDRHCMFWSDNQLQSLLTKPRISEAFGRRDELKHLSGKVDEIIAKHLKILAILALMGELICIEEFMANSIHDWDLPLVQCTKGNPLSWNIARDTRKGRRLKFLDKWSVDQRYFFLCRWQFHVSPPTFRMATDGKSAKHEEFPADTVMPWKERHRENGGYSQVSEVDIHPDCHDFGPVLDDLGVRELTFM